MIIDSVVPACVVRVVRRSVKNFGLICSWCVKISVIVVNYNLCNFLCAVKNVVCVLLCVSDSDSESVYCVPNKKKIAGFRAVLRRVC